MLFFYRNAIDIFPAKSFVLIDVMLKKIISIE